MSRGSIPPAIQSFPVALKVKKKTKNKPKQTNSSGAQRREQSRGTRGECSLVLFIGKAGFQESKDNREEEQNLAIEQVGQCSCS